MHVRILTALVVAVVFASTFPTFAQQRFPFARRDRSAIHLCPTETLPKGYKVWKEAGTAPLLPEVLGSGPEMIHLFFAHDLMPEFLNPTELQILDRMTPAENTRLSVARQAVNQVSAQYLFTPLGTPKPEVPTAPPPEFRKKISEAMSPENLELVVVPCGTVLYGTSYGTDVSDGKDQPAILANVVYEPWALGWYEEGVVAPNGKPGVRIWRTMKPVTIESGHNKGNKVSPYVIVWCGNLSFDLAPIQFTADVVAPLPVEPKKPAVIIPPPPRAPATSKPEKRVVVAPRPKGGGWVPCFKGKYNKLVCAGIFGGIAALAWPDGNPNITNPQPTNNTSIKK